MENDNTNTEANKEDRRTSNLRWLVLALCCCSTVLFNPYLAWRLLLH